MSEWCTVTNQWMLHGRTSNTATYTYVWQCNVAVKYYIDRDGSNERDETLLEGADSKERPEY